MRKLNAFSRTKVRLGRITMKFWWKMTLWKVTWKWILSSWKKRIKAYETHGCNLMRASIIYRRIQAPSITQTYKVTNNSKEKSSDLKGWAVTKPEPFSHNRPNSFQSLIIKSITQCYSNNHKKSVEAPIALSHHKKVLTGMGHLSSTEAKTQ